ncbi:MAG: AtpZ/AtpI family protein [Gemmataceae bacterium]
MKLVEDPKRLAFYLGLSQIGMEMVAPIVAGLVLDHYLGWEPWGVAAGTILGFGGGLYHLLALLKRQEEHEQNSRRDPS